MAPAARTHGKHHPVPGPQGNRHKERYKLPNRSDAGTKHNRSVGRDTGDFAHAVLRAAKFARYGILATGRRSEYKVGTLATNARHEQELVRQEIDIPIINGGPIIVLGGGRCASVSRR